MYYLGHNLALPLQYELVYKHLLINIITTSFLFFFPPIGISYSNKVLVEFDEAFWPTDVGVFTRPAESEEEAGLLQTWFNLHQLVNKPILMGSIVGPIAKTFESWSDDEVKVKGRELFYIT